MPSARETFAEAVWTRAAGRRVFAFDDTGNTFQVRRASKDSRSFDRGEMKLAANVTHVCVEGDDEWQPLPGAVTTARMNEVAAGERARTREAVRRAGKRRADLHFGLFQPEPGAKARARATAPRDRFEEWKARMRAKR